MNYKLSSMSLLVATAVAVMPLSPANASSYHHGGYGRGGFFYGLVGVGTALTVAAATLITAPVRLVADAARDPVVVPPPTYYTPQTYAYPAYPQTSYYPSAYPAYGYPRQTVVYGYPAPIYGNQ